MLKNILEHKNVIKLVVYSNRLSLSNKIKIRGENKFFNHGRATNLIHSEIM